jgi:hypothetical protein
MHSCSQLHKGGCEADETRLLLRHTYAPATVLRAKRPGWERLRGSKARKSQLLMAVGICAGTRPIARELYV